ncbi:hypothetical protein L207DRAFT_584390 [Hyaloscypha variabilis F]|uniref:Uncharacterized protein n=1 Tax=Hyaloscypha variabilis (strain UAMH 11265 / GT02V1 / F) TaxID=1149755 RepID=A0A2J6RKE4_HYAVF|nr:hypothetical protein L207DRAFT_584390 [Hyaloscypha variabilis F]
MAPTETAEAASIPELNHSSSSLSHVFPQSISPPATVQPKPEKESVSITFTPSQIPPRPKKGYLHRTPTGKLTEIGPSPLCQETTKTLLDEAEEKEGNGIIYAGYRIFHKDPRDFSGKEASSEKAISTKDQEEVVTGLRYVGYRMTNRNPKIFLRSEPAYEKDKSILDNDADHGLNATSDTSRLDYTTYPGSKKSDTDPRTLFVMESGYPQYDCTLEEKGSEYGFDVKLPPDEASTYSQSSSSSSSEGDELSIYSEHPDVLETSTRSLSPCRTFPVASKPPRPWELCFTTIKPEEYDFEVVKRSSANEQNLGGMLRTTCQKPAITIPNRRQPLFNPTLNQEVKIDSERAEPSTTPNSHDVARLEFMNRRGRLWDMANKSLERLFLQATELKESEFLDLVSCNMDEVQTWLDEHGPYLIKRSMAKRIKACETLRNAGIQPCEISEEVMDVFELMNEQEQAGFIRKFQRLFALVKSSQERLHLTPSEMEHFSKLSLADKYSWLDVYKNKREERERKIRRDTAIFTAKLRRTYRESDELLFPDCSSPHAIRELNCIAPETRCKRGFFDDHQKEGRHTVFTGDNRTCYRKLDKINTIDEKAQSKRISRLAVRYGGFTSNGVNLTVREVAASDSEESTLLPTDMALTDMPGAEAEQQNVKEVAAIDNSELEVLDDGSQDCDCYATSMLSTEQAWENDHKEDVDTEEDDIPETILREHVLRRSARKEWLESHTGSKIPTEGVIPPAVPGKLTVNNKARTTMCIKDTLPVGPEISGGTKSEPCTPHTERYHDIRTRDIEACVAKVDVLGAHADVPYSTKPMVTYCTPSRPSCRSAGGSPSAYSPECDWKKSDGSQKSSRSLRKKVSSFFGSLRSKRRRLSTFE